MLQLNERVNIAGMIVTLISTVVKAIDLVDRFKHRKSSSCIFSTESPPIDSGSSHM